MTDDPHRQLRAVLLRQREAHQKLFELQGRTIDALRDALEAVARTQDEMSKLFLSDTDLEDLIS
jgi:predicted RNA-binding protein YlqC (UPF0109 family)